MLPTLHVQLLGDFRLVYSEELVTSINTARLKSLLAYLMLHRHVPQPRQHLAFLFWPDSNEAQAFTNLRRELHYLRRVLPDADRFLQADAKTLHWQLHAPFTLDVADFESAVALAEEAEQVADLASMRTALEKAAGLYQGDLLPGCYDEWILPEQERLRQKCIRALECLIRLLEEQRNYHSAIRYAQQLLRVDPLHETTYCCLMHLHALNGDRASALCVYHDCTKVLQRELDVEPSPATRATYERLLNMDMLPSSQLPVQPRVSVAAPTRTKPQSPSSPSLLPLVGREREWAAIRSWMTPVAGKSVPEVLLLIGEPGIGKTRLLEEIGKKVRTANGCVLWGRGFEAEMVRPYGAWIEALRSISPAWLSDLPADLDSLLPEVGAALEGPANRGRLFDAVVQLLSQLSANCTLTTVILDDVQWLDEASTALLHYVARLLSDSPVLLACAARQREVVDNAPVFRLLQALRREQRVQRIELVPLDREQTTELARSLDPNVDGKRVFADSGGNPLFVLEVARALVHQETTRSDNLEALIQDRLLQLDETARELMPWAAALGRSFNPTTVAHVADCSLAKLLAAMEQLERHGIIRPGASVNGETGYDFAHDIVRQVAYRQLSEPRCRLVHLQIAHTLDKLSTGDNALASDVAHHASLGGDHKLAASACLTAAERCLRLFAYTEAAELAQRGIQHCQYLDARTRVRLYLGLLKVYVLSGVTKDRVSQLEDKLHQLTAEAGALSLKDEEAIGLEALIALNHEHGNLTGVQEHSLRAAERGRAASPTTTARMLAYTGWCLAEIEREMPRAKALLLEAQSLAARVSLEIIDISSGLGIVCYYDADYAGASLFLEKAWRRTQAEQDHWRECICLKYLALLELEVGKPSAALAYSREIATVAAKMGDEGSEGPSAVALNSLAQYALGQEEAEDALEQALSTLRQIDDQRMLAYTLTFAAEIDLENGRVELAIARAQEALPAAQVVDYRSGIAIAWATIVRGILTLGEHQRAVEHFQDLQCQIDNRALSVRARTVINHLAQQLET